MIRLACIIWFLATSFAGNQDHNGNRKFSQMLANITKICSAPVNEQISGICSACSLEQILANSLQRVCSRANIQDLICHSSCHSKHSLKLTIIKPWHQTPIIFLHTTSCPGPVPIYEHAFPCWLLFPRLLLKLPSTSKHRSCKNHRLFSLTLTFLLILHHSKDTQTYHSYNCCNEAWRWNTRRLHFYGIE